MSNALARAISAGTLPPSERETYQIHIPWRSNGVLVIGGASSTPPAPPVTSAAAGAAACAPRARAASTASSARTGRRLWGLLDLTSPLNTVVIEALRSHRAPLNINS